jgi:hypothetical protein
MVRRTDVRIAAKIIKMATRDFQTVCVAIADIGTFLSVLSVKRTDFYDSNAFRRR